MTMTLPNGAQATNDTAAQIRAAVDAALAQIASDSLLVKDAKDMLDSTRDDSIGMRESLITKLAHAATLGSWNGDDVDAVVKESLKARNDKKNAAVATFGAELRRCCRPSVRPHVAANFALARKAFAEEAVAAAALREADPKATVVMPLRKAFARAYHMVVGPLSNEAREGRVYTDESELTAFAVRTLRDRQVDYTRVAKRLAAIRVELAKFGDDFPVPGIASCVEFLSEIDASDLRVARENSQADDAGDDASEPEAEVASEPEVEVAQGVSDLLADALADLAA